MVQTKSSTSPFLLSTWPCIRCLITRYHREKSEQQRKCLYDDERPHFAFHVRLGDRTGSVESMSSYIEHLEGVMDVISTATKEKEMRPPLFHVFTETLMPCPSQETGLFDEFLSWPIEADKVQAR